MLFQGLLRTIRTLFNTKRFLKQKKLFMCNKNTLLTFIFVPHMRHLSRVLKINTLLLCSYKTTFYNLYLLGWYTLKRLLFLSSSVVAIFTSQHSLLSKHSPLVSSNSGIIFVNHQIIIDTCTNIPDAKCRQWLTVAAQHLSGCVSEDNSLLLLHLGSVSTVYKHIII